MTIGFDRTSYDLIELPGELPEELPYIIDDGTLAFYLGIRPKILWYIMHTRTTKQYTVHRIPKKKGGLRVIHAPSDLMREVLQRFNVHFLAPLHDKLGNHVTAYRSGRSVIDAVKQHIPPCPVCDAHPPDTTPEKHECPRNGTLIQMDLQDFFPRTSMAKIRNYFKSQGYSHYVSGLMANLVTVRDIPNDRYDEMVTSGMAHVPKKFAGAPQGAPTSGAICNLVADQLLDPYLLGLMEKLSDKMGLKGVDRWVYTRYSDDLTFSCGQQLPQDEIQNIIEEIISRVALSGYWVNLRKTRVTPASRRRVILGTVANRHPNCPRESYYRYRAITHNCLLYGFNSQASRAGKDSTPEFKSWLQGNILWIKQQNPERGEKLHSEYKDALKVHTGDKNE